MDNQGPFDTFKSKIPVPEAPFMSTSRASYLAQLSDQMFFDDDDDNPPTIDRGKRSKPPPYSYGPPSILHEPPSPAGSPTRTRGVPSITHHGKSRKKISALKGMSPEYVEERMEELLGEPMDNPMEDEEQEEAVDELFLAKLSRSMEQITGDLNSPTRRERERRMAEDSRKRISARVEKRVGSQARISEPTQTTPRTDESSGELTSGSPDPGPSTALEGKSETGKKSKKVEKVGDPNRKVGSPGKAPGSPTKGTGSPKKVKTTVSKSEGVVGTPSKKESDVLVGAAITGQGVPASLEKKEEAPAVVPIGARILGVGVKPSDADKEQLVKETAQTIALIQLCKAADWHGVEAALKVFEKQIANGTLKDTKPLEGAVDEVSLDDLNAFLRFYR